MPIKWEKHVRHASPAPGMELMFSYSASILNPPSLTCPHSLYSLLFVYLSGLVVLFVKGMGCVGARPPGFETQLSHYGSVTMSQFLTLSVLHSPRLHTGNRKGAYHRGLF